MRKTLERFLRSADVPNPERAEELWAEYRTGGPGADKAFATLLAWYGNAVYRRIWGFVRSDAAEDVFQDLLARLHKRREKLATFEHALRWMRVVAVAFSLNALRADKRQRTRDRRVARPEADPPAERSEELQEMLRVGLAKLPDEYKEAVALHYFEGLTKRDAAAVLGIDRDTLAKRLQEALAKLRQLVPAPAVAAAGGVAGLEAKLAATPPLSPARMAALITAAGCGSALAGWLASTKAKVLAAVLVVGVVSAVSGYVLSRRPDMPPKSPNLGVRLGVEPLEARTVPAAGFLSALGVGNAEGPTTSGDVAVDTAGNRYVTGSFMGTVDFDPARTHPGGADILTARGTGDIYVAKYAPDDTLIWARRMGGDAVGPSVGLSNELGRAIALDGSGNVYVAGSFRGTADFGPFTRTSAGEADAFVVKLNPDGTAVWATRLGGTSGDSAAGIGVDASGNVYVSGALNSSLNTPTTDFVTKLSPNGSVSWTKTVVTRSGGIGTNLAVDAAGNTYLAGQFYGTVDFDPGTGSGRVHTVTSGTYNSAYVLKLDSAGSFRWVCPLIGQGSGTTAGCPMIRSVAVDGAGNVIVGGRYSNTVDFDPGTGVTTLPSQAQAGFVAKLTNSPTQVSLAWVRGLESADGRNQVSALTVDAAGNIYASGFYNGSVDFDPGAGTHTGPSNTVMGNLTFAWKLDAGGHFVWSTSLGMGGRSDGTSVAVDATGTVSIFGGFSETVDLDPDPIGTFELTSPPNQMSIYLVKLSQN